MTTPSEFEIDYLDAGIQNVLNGVKLSGDEYMKLYDTVYRFCTEHDQDKEMYDKYKEAMNGHVQTRVLPLLRDKRGEELLNALRTHWVNHKVVLRRLSGIFQYLETDSGYISLASLPSLQDIADTYFFDMVHDHIHTRIASRCAAIIDSELDKYRNEESFLKHAVDLYSEMESGKQGRLMDSLLTKLLTAYYARQASYWMGKYYCDNYSFAGYMSEAKRCLKGEDEPLCKYLPSCDKTKLAKIARSEVLMKHASLWLDRCFATSQLEDLSLMFSLLSETSEGLDLVASKFRQHVENEMKVVQDAAKKAENVELIADLLEKMMRYVMRCFNNNIQFEAVLKAGVRSATWDSSFVEELVASYFDKFLQNKVDLCDEAIKERIDKMVRLLPYINSEDRFAQTYWRKLSLRLVSNKSENVDQERLLLNKLKFNLGPRFSSKMDQMISDMVLADEIINAYLLSDSSVANHGIKLKVNVLNAVSWPPRKTSKLNPSPEMVTCVDAFNKFYKSHFMSTNLNVEGEPTSRKLTWSYSLGTCQLDCKFDNKTIQLILGNYQAAALLLFNEADSLSFHEIKSKLNLDEDDIMSILHSLSCSEYKVLTKVPDTTTIFQSDSFRFNSEFDHERDTIEIPLLPIETKKVVKIEQKDWSDAIKASIVRIMKLKKKLKFLEIVKECIEQLGRWFTPDVEAIKEMVDDLIKQGYLECDDDNQEVYKYVA